jgi:hypothetical protein
MHIERIYIQDNFVPDIVSDQFRRKVIGVSICLKEGEGTRDAEEFAEEYIAEYIKKNTVNPFVSGVSIVADNAVVPIVHVEKEEPKSITEYIESCTELKVLESYRLIAQTRLEYKEAYDKKLKELQ